MTLNESDIARIEQIVLDANETVRKGSIKIDGNLLKFRVDGTDGDGNNAIKALMMAGLNVYSDGDLETIESFAVWAKEATHSDVTITINEGGLWR